MAWTAWVAGDAAGRSALRVERVPSVYRNRREMPFSEKVREQVRFKAAFRCCICGEIGIEVHHIVPQGKGGEDTLHNAAPLCPNCHAWFGDNPRKRKEI